MLLVVVDGTAAAADTAAASAAASAADERRMDVDGANRGEPMEEVGDDHHFNQVLPRVGCPNLQRRRAVESL